MAKVRAVISSNVTPFTQVLDLLGEIGSRLNEYENDNDSEDSEEDNGIDAGDSEDAANEDDDMRLTRAALRGISDFEHLFERVQINMKIRKNALKNEESTSEDTNEISSPCLWLELRNNCVLTDGEKTITSVLKV